MMTVTITKEEALEIAEEAEADAGYDITDYVGYYTIAEDEDADDNVDIAINKDRDEKTHTEYYAIYISPLNYFYGEWVYTQTLDVNELAEKILETAKAVCENKITFQD